MFYYVLNAALEHTLWINTCSKSLIQSLKQFNFMSPSYAGMAASSKGPCIGYDPAAQPH